MSNYKLTQAGEKVQDILNRADKLSEGGFGYTDASGVDHKINSKYIDGGSGSGLPEATVPGTAAIFDGNGWVAQEGYGYTAEDTKTINLSASDFNMHEGEDDKYFDIAEEELGGSTSKACEKLSDVFKLLNVEHVGESVTLEIDGISHTETITEIPAGRDDTCYILSDKNMLEEETPDYFVFVQVISGGVVCAQQVKIRSYEEDVCTDHTVTMTTSIITTIVPELVSNDTHGFGYIIPGNGKQITWDGNTEGKDSFSFVFDLYKISNDFVDLESAELGGYVTIQEEDESEKIPLHHIDYDSLSNILTKNNVQFEVLSGDPSKVNAILVFIGNIPMPYLFSSEIQQELKLKIWFKTTTDEPVDMEGTLSVGTYFAKWTSEGFIKELVYGGNLDKINQISSKYIPAQGLSGHSGVSIWRGDTEQSLIFESSKNKCDCIFISPRTEADDIELNKVFVSTDFVDGYTRVIFKRLDGESTDDTISFNFNYLIMLAQADPVDPYQPWDYAQESTNIKNLKLNKNTFIDKIKLQSKSILERK